MMLYALCYGLGHTDFCIRGFEVSPSPKILLPLPGTSSNTVGGTVSSLEDDYSDKEELSSLLAFLGVTVHPSCFISSGGLPLMLWAPSLGDVSSMPSSFFASPDVGLNGSVASVALSYLIFSPSMAFCNPPRVPNVVRDFPRLLA